jgi:hypothetical protein
MPKSEDRARRARKARYGPRTTNPGLRIIQRQLAFRSRPSTPCDDCYRADGTHDPEVEH